METNEELIRAARSWNEARLRDFNYLAHTPGCPEGDHEHGLVGAERLLDRLADALEAATTGTEWEYGRDCSPYGVDEWDSEQEARVAVQSWRGSSLVRRRPAGPWIPVEGEGP